MTVMMLLILHEYIITQLGVFATVTAGAAVRSAIRSVSDIEHLTVGTAGAIFQSPPVVISGQIIYVFFFESGSDTILCAFLVSGGILVTGKYSGSQMIRIKSEHLGQQFKTPLAAFLLKIISKAPASHHLEEGYMAFVAYGINIVGTYTALYVAESGTQRVLLSQQIRHQRLHTGNVEHNTGRTVGYQGYCSHIYVTTVYIKLFPGFSQFIRSELSHSLGLLVSIITSFGK